MFVRPAALTELDVVVVPALNEKDSIAFTIDEIKVALRDMGSKSWSFPSAQLSPTRTITEPDDDE